ncbi:jerky protein homolog-like [Trichonephila clavipes]|nr:jerky protein homolog-like [Trichonephila clavipes]
MREANDVLDRALYLWISQSRSKGGPISSPLLCEKALKLTEKLGGSTSTGGVEEVYSRGDVYNVDETGVNWKALSRKSLASKRESTAPGFKVSKERVTAMVCANGSGTHSLPLLVIGKSKISRCSKNVSCLPTLYKAQKSKVLLILDNAPCHLPVEILNAIDDDFSVLYLPSNVTALVQPMDQGIIERLKRIYRKQVLRRLLLAENDKESVPPFAEKLNIKDTCYMLAEAWDSLERQSPKNAWNKLWPDLEAEKGFNDDHREEITDVVQSIPGFQECDEDVENWMACDAENCGF